MNTTILRFHKIIENIIQKKQFGMITVNVVVQKGVPDLRTLNVVVQKRKKYSLNKTP